METPNHSESALVVTGATIACTRSWDFNSVRYELTVVNGTPESPLPINSSDLRRMGKATVALTEELMENLKEIVPAKVRSQNLT